MSNPNEDDFDRAMADQPHGDDEALKHLSHSDALILPAARRLRWFHLAQVWHRELIRVHKDVQELLDPENDVRIISLIGMTGIGKTTFANNLVAGLVDQFSKDLDPSHVPLIYVRAPANGERSFSWKVLYSRMLTAGAEVLVSRKKARRVVERAADGKPSVAASNTLSGMREYLENMIKNRHVRVIVIDEAIHLLRFDKQESVTDTLKSLADIHNVKLILIGSYDITELVRNYGQVVRRAEIVHYKRYRSEEKAPATDKEMSADQMAFRTFLGKLNDMWPSVNKPQLLPHWHVLMKCSCGSVGMLKSALLRLASLQLQTPGEVLTNAAWRKCVKDISAVKKIEMEATEGEAGLAEATYGETYLAGVQLVPEARNG